MGLHSILNKIDRLVCAYLGLEHEETKPQTVILKKGKVIIQNTTSFNHHAIKQSWDEFSHMTIKQIDQAEKEKLGLALGKALAKKLVVSFHESHIN